MLNFYQAGTNPLHFILYTLVEPPGVSHFGQITLPGFLPETTARKFKFFCIKFAQVTFGTYYCTLISY